MSEKDLLGNLDFLKIWDVMQLLGTAGASGVLTIQSPYVEAPGRVYLENGNVCDATFQTDSGEDVLYSLFGWSEGRFLFSRGPAHNKKSIRKGNMELIMEGLRLLDEGVIKTVGAVSSEKQSQGRDGKGDIPLILGPIVDYLQIVDEDSFADGDDLIVEGRYGKWAWVILEGTVEVVKKTIKGEYTVLRLGAGSFIGSSVFISKKLYRTATVRAVGKVQVGVLNQENLDRELSGVSRRFKRLLESFVMRLTRITGNLTDLDTGKPHDLGFPNGKSLIKQGSENFRVFEIISGDAYLQKEDQGKCFPIMNLTRGDFVGEIPFFKDGLEPGTASVIVSESCEYKEVSVEEIFEEYESLSQTFKNLLSNISVFVSVTSTLLSRRIIDDMDSGKPKK